MSTTPTSKQSTILTISTAEHKTRRTGTRQPSPWQLSCNPVNSIAFLYAPRVFPEASLPPPPPAYSHLDVLEELTLEVDHIKDECRSNLLEQEAKLRSAQNGLGTRVEECENRVSVVGGELEAMREEFAEGQDRVTTWRAEVDEMVGCFCQEFGYRQVVQADSICEPADRGFRFQLTVVLLLGGNFDSALHVGMRGILSGLFIIQGGVRFFPRSAPKPTA